LTSGRKERRRRGREKRDGIKNMQIPGEIDIGRNEGLRRGREERW
jgi:hypothetical protein